MELLSIFDLSDTMIEVRYCEVQELYFAIFLMIYLLSIRKRLRLSS